MIIIKIDRMYSILLCDAQTPNSTADPPIIPYFNLEEEGPHKDSTEANSKDSAEGYSKDQNSKDPAEEISAYSSPSMEKHDSTTGKSSLGAPPLKANS